MRHKKLKPKDFPPPSCIGISRYTEESASEMGIKITEDNYGKVIGSSLKNYLWETMDFLYNKFDVSDNMKIRVVPIHKNYFELLKENDQDDSDMPVVEYVRIEEDNSIMDEMRELGWDDECLVLGLHVIVQTDSKDTLMQWKLSKDTCRCIERTLKECGCEKEVHVPGYVLKIRNAVDNFDKLLVMSEAHFKDGTEIIRGDFAEQRKKPEENFINAFIPIYVRYKLDKPVMTVLEWDEYMDDMFLLTNEDPNNPDAFELFDESEVVKKIKNEFVGANNIFITPYICDIDLILEEIEGMEKEIKKGLRKKGGKMVFLKG